MRLDPLFDIRDALREGGDTLTENAPAYITRLLDVIDAIQTDCRFADDHAGGWGDTAAVYTENVWDNIRHFGSPS